MKSLTCQGCFTQMPTSFVEGDECDMCGSTDVIENVVVSRSEQAHQAENNYEAYHILFADEYVPAVSYDAEFQPQLDGPYVFDAEAWTFETHSSARGDHTNLRQNDLMLPALRVISLAGRALGNQEIIDILVKHAVVPARAKAETKVQLGWALHYLLNAKLIAYRGESVYGCTEHGLTILDLDEAEARAKLQVIYDRLYWCREDRFGEKVA